MLRPTAAAASVVPVGTPSGTPLARALPWLLTGAAVLLQIVYPLMPDGYRSRDCRAGGPMDERLADAPWLAPGRP